MNFSEPCKVGIRLRAAAVVGHRVTFLRRSGPDWGDYLTWVSFLAFKYGTHVLLGAGLLAFDGCAGL